MNIYRTAGTGALKPELIRHSGLLERAIEYNRLKNRAKAASASVSKSRGALHARGRAAPIAAAARIAQKIVVGAFALSIFISPMVAYRSAGGHAVAPQNQVALRHERVLQHIHTAPLVDFPTLSQMPQLRALPELIPAERIHSHNRYRQVTAFELGRPDHGTHAWIDSFNTWSFGRFALNSRYALPKFMNYLRTNSPEYYRRMQSAMRSTGVSLTRAPTASQLTRFNQVIREFGNDPAFVALEHSFMDHRYRVEIATLRNRFGFDINRADELTAAIVLPSINNAPGRVMIIMGETLRLASLKTGRPVDELRETSYLTSLPPSEFADLFHRASTTVLTNWGWPQVARLKIRRYNEHIRPLAEANMVYRGQAEKIALEREQAELENAATIQAHAIYNAARIDQYLIQVLTQLSSMGWTPTTAASLDATARAVRAEITPGLAERIKSGDYDPALFSEEVLVMFASHYDKITVAYRMLDPRGGESETASQTTAAHPLALAWWRREGANRN